MRFSRFFVDRPIFAAVLSLVIVVAGAIALFQLPISEYPQVVPPTVVVRASYPGANPRVIAETVASPLEQQINGVEDMLYMFSQATSDRRMTLTVTFALGTDLDNAQVQVQNRVAQALPRLPAEAQRIGVVTEEIDARFHHGRSSRLAGRTLRPALSGELRHPSSERRARTHPRRRQRTGVRRG